ncbi:unnamed protein product [Closterium sp. NIES-54]
MPSWRPWLPATERSRDPLSPLRKSAGSGCLVHPGLPQGQAAWTRDEYGRGREVPPETAETAPVPSAPGSPATTPAAPPASVPAAPTPAVPPAPAAPVPPVRAPPGPAAPAPVVPPAAPVPAAPPAALSNLYLLWSI